jgi:hypothetical protein
VLFVNIDNLLNKTLQKQLNAMKNKNYFEAAIVKAIAEHLMLPSLGADPEQFIKPKNAAVVTPYPDQQLLLSRMLKEFRL